MNASTPRKLRPAAAPRAPPAGSSPTWPASPRAGSPSSRGFAFPKLRTSRIPWKGRGEDKDDPGVWAVTCLIVGKGFRGRGLTYLLARATVPFAREHGARALEAYPMFTRPGKTITWGELHVGARQVFEDAGFTQVTHPSPRRFVMRVDFTR